MYIGGGTPSLLKINHLEQIFQEFSKLKFLDNFEATMEINPATGDKKYFQFLKSFGINRISVGCQSFNDNLLKLLGRVHSVVDIYNTIGLIRDSEIGNISIDLMYGLPEQTIELWQDTLEKAINLEIPHISAYGLKIEPDTPFYSKYNNKIPEEPAAEMFLITDKILNSSSYRHYEISNYSKTGYECKHNLTYWKNNPYIGLGLAAHSFINNTRMENTSSLDKYLNFRTKLSQMHKITPQKLIEDEIFLKLRLAEGINLNDFYIRHKIDFIEKYQPVINKYRHLFHINTDSICLNVEGMLMSNYILCEFIE